MKDATLFFDRICKIASTYQWQGKESTYRGSASRRFRTYGEVLTRVQGAASRSCNAKVHPESSRRPSAYILIVPQEDAES
jgi:hypothetical protein